MVRKKNLLSIIPIIILAVILLVAIVFFFLSIANYWMIKGEIASKCGLIYKLTERSKTPLTKESLFFVTNEYDNLKRVYSRFKLALESPLNEEIHQEELDPLQFKERLIQTQKKLHEDARMYNLSLPESLGFAEYETELSEPSEIPDLIKRLRVLEELLYTITLSDIDSLHEINFVKEDTKEETSIYFDIPVSFKIGCTTSSLIDLLYKLRLSPFNFVVEDMDIEISFNKEAATDRRLVASLKVKATALY